MAAIPSTEHGGDPSYPGAGKHTGAYVSGHTPTARRKGPGYIWSYTDPKTKVEYLTFPEGLLKAQEEHCNDLLGKIEESMAVVLPKPSEFKFAGAVSGRSLQETKARQYDRCDQYRDDIEEGFFLPSVQMQMRIALRAGGSLDVAGAAKALPILQGFDNDLASA